MANTKITSRVIADDAVLTANIADDAVTSAKLDTNIAIAGTLGVTGAVTADAGVSIDNITIDGTEIDLSSGDLTVDVAGNITLDADDAGEVRFKDGGTHYGTIKKDGDNTLIQSIVADGDLKFQGIDGSSFVTPLTLDMSVGGQVQITNATNHPMTVQSTATNGGYIQYSLGHQGALIGYMGSANQLLSAGGNTDYCIRYQNNFLVGYGTAEKFRLDSSGNCGIGSTSPQAKLHVHDASSGVAIRASGEGNNNRKVEIAYSASDGPYIAAGSSGINSLKFFTDNTGHRMTIDGSGNIGAPTGTNIYNASDERLKQNITSLDNSLEMIKNLNPVKFNWIDNFSESENGKTLYGFIAQEVQDVFPDAIAPFGDGKPLTVDNKVIENPLTVREKFLVPMLVKAIQELSAEVEELKAKLESE